MCPKNSDFDLSSLSKIISLIQGFIGIVTFSMAYTHRCYILPFQGFNLLICWSWFIC